LIAAERTILAGSIIGSARSGWGEFNESGNLPLTVHS
jgi:hypothetical protein